MIKNWMISEIYKRLLIDSLNQFVSEDFTDEKIL